MKRLTALLPLLFASLFMSAAVFAQQDEEDPSSRESPPAVWKNPRNYEAIFKAYEMVSNEQYDEAQNRFSELMERFKDPYERSEAARGLAQVYMAKDRIDLALPLMEEVINLDVLPNKPHFESMIQLANLYYSLERYNDAIRWLDRWSAESGRTDVRVHEMRASIFAQQERYRDAISEIDQAIALEDDPKKSWYQLKLAMHYELKEFPESKSVLELLIRKWPDEKQFWTQLSAINVTLKKDQEALSVLSLAHRKGMLTTEQELIQLFSLYGYLEVPLKAAETLAEGLDNGVIDATKRRWEDLGNAWYAARELPKAIDALGKAADLSLDGKLDMQVAYMLVEQEAWENAITRLAAAIEKGGLSESEVGNLHLLLGMSKLNSGDDQGARQAFNEARRFPKARASAQQWLNHMEERAKRRRVAAN